MRKLILTIVFAALLSSCGGKSAESIRVDEIKDACGCADAIVIVTEDIFSFLESKGVDEPYDNVADELSYEDFEVIQSKSKKLSEINNHCREDLGVERMELESCEAYPKVLENLEKIKK